MSGFVTFCYKMSYFVLPIFVRAIKTAFFRVSPTAVIDCRYRKIEPRITLPFTTFVFCRWEVLQAPPNVKQYH